MDLHGSGRVCGGHHGVQCQPHLFCDLLQRRDLQAARPVRRCAGTGAHRLRGEAGRRAADRRGDQRHAVGSRSPFGLPEPEELPGYAGSDQGRVRRARHRSHDGADGRREGRVAHRRNAGSEGRPDGERPDHASRQ